MIKRGLQGLLKQFGYRSARANDSVVPNCGLSNFFPLIKKFGFNPEHILDVGANHANFTREAVHYFPRAHYTLVEPQEQIESSRSGSDRSRTSYSLDQCGRQRPGRNPAAVHYRVRSEQHFFAGAENRARFGSNRRSAAADPERNCGFVAIARSGDGEN
jgi:hypothetical protein